MGEPEPPKVPGSSQEKGPAERRRAVGSFVLFALLTGAAIVWFQIPNDGRSSEISYSAFYDLVEGDQVSAVAFDRQSLVGRLKGKQLVEGVERMDFHTTLPYEDTALLALLHDKKVVITAVSVSTPWFVSFFVSVLPWVVIPALLFFMSRRASGMLGAGGQLGKFVRNKSHRFEKAARVTTTFDDIAGLKVAKRDLREIVDFLRDPVGFKRLGAKVPRGVLLVGPPGTGKTLLARAVAGEAAVPFFSIAASEFVEMFVGVGAARVRDLFAEAQKVSPAIVFIDEIDAVGRARGAGFGGGHDEREQTLNQLLSEMDGFGQEHAIIVLAATNRPDVLDPALLRPGRFDRRVVLDRPEVEARQAILDVHSKYKPLAADVNLQTLARTTTGFTGADLANLVNEAALLATRRGADSLASRDFSVALDKIVLGDPRETKLDEKEKRRVSVHESGHAIVASFSPHSEPVHRVSILPRGMTLGATQQLPSTDRHILTRSELESRLGVLLAGSAAEQLLLKEISTGAANDFKEASKLASQMVAHYGMSQALGPVYYEHETEHPFLGQRIASDGSTSPATLAAIESETRGILARAHASATKVLVRQRAELERLVDALLLRETVEGADLAEILKGSPVSPGDGAFGPGVATTHA